MGLSLDELELTKYTSPGRVHMAWSMVFGNEHEDTSADMVLYKIENACVLPSMDSCRDAGNKVAFDNYACSAVSSELVPASEGSHPGMHNIATDNPAHSKPSHPCT